MVISGRKRTQEEQLSPALIHKRVFDIQYFGSNEADGLSAEVV